jgi:transcriptional regulator with XRE-family HTH domain
VARLFLFADQEQFQMARIDLGWTQTELAERIQYSTSYVSQVERGLRTPSPKFIRSVCEALNKPRDVLFLTERKESSLAVN